MSDAPQDPNRVPEPGRLSPLDELGVNADPADMEMYIDAAHKAFLLDKTSALPAFDALSYVVASHWTSDEPAPHQLINVPWWALEIIVEGFMRYVDAARTGRITTFGEAFGLEGGGQGKRPRIKEHLQTKRNRNIAWWIALRIQRDGFKVEKAVAEIAERYQLSEPSVWLVWRDLGTQAAEGIRNFLSLKSSRSD